MKSLIACFAFTVLAATGSPALASPLALVYNGDGACPDDCAKSAALIAEKIGFRVRYINAETWDSSVFEDASLWIHPGGVASLAVDEFTSAQKQSIRNFIARGGGYVGFCAGAFFAADSFYSNGPSHRKFETLEILPVEAEVRPSKTQASMLYVEWGGVRRHLYFEGGAVFRSPIPAGVEVIGTYDDGGAATVRGLYGKGRVYITGPHPEAPQDWRTYFQLTDKDGLDEDLVKEMYSWAAGR